MIFRTSKREEFLKYTWMDKEQRYHAYDNDIVTSWVWKTEGTLCAVTTGSEPMVDGEWTIDPAKIPKSLVVFLQFIRYTRYGFANVNNSLAIQHADASPIISSGSGNNSNSNSNSNYNATGQIGPSTPQVS